MIFWLVLKLEISYYRVIIISPNILVSFERMFLKFTFLHGEILSFHDSFLFGLKILFSVNGKAISVTHPLLLVSGTSLLFMKDL